MRIEQRAHPIPYIDAELVCSLAHKAQRFSGNGMERLGLGPESSMLATKEFDRLDTFAKLQQAPKVKFKDLEASITTRITYNILPMQARVDYVKVTDYNVLANITIQFENRDLQFQLKDGMQKSEIHLLGRISTMPMARESICAGEPCRSGALACNSGAGPADGTDAHRQACECLLIACSGD